jgi:hypothetical protein
MRTEHDDIAMDLQQQVGVALLGLGALCLIVSIIWLTLRSAGIGPTESYIGAEGMLTTSIIFIALGGWQWRSATSAQRVTD